jgi:hypothetical protein
LHRNPYLYILIQVSALSTLVLLIHFPEREEKSGNDGADNEAGKTEQYNSSQRGKKDKQRVQLNVPADQNRAQNIIDGADDQSSRQ